MRHHAPMRLGPGHGAMLRPLFAELHDPASPVSAYRERALDDIRALVRETFTELGRPVPAPLDLDAALHVCEYMGYRISAATGPGLEPDAETLAAGRHIAAARPSGPQETH